MNTPLPPKGIAPPKVGHEQAMANAAAAADRHERQSKGETIALIAQLVILAGIFALFVTSLFWL